MNVIAREAEHLLPVYAQMDLEPIRAEGPWIHTADGRKILDFYGGHAVAALGYGHPRLVETLNRQAQLLMFQSNAVALEVRARAAQRLAEFAPAGLTHAFFVNSGAEANENALRMACKATGRARVVALEHGFHGRTAAAAAVTWGAEKWYGFPQRPFEVVFVSREDPDALRTAVDERTAAVILEPVQGVAGAYDVPLEVLKAARAACDAAGAWLISDEVQSGMGRSGYAFAIERAGVTPDILTMAKSLGGGFPVGALITRPEIAATQQVGDLGTTFGGGPLACAIVETVIDVIEREQLVQRVARLSQRIRETCIVGPVTAIQGAGFLLGLRTSRPARDINRELLARDIMAGGSADPHIVRLLPPYILDDSHVVQLATALKEIAA
ncbi:MAG: aspartate aminotransferase family protein [Gammaproteobacteria bacterium]|nr:aspartate aminotransferase family protein [Gammaproteobacteria bacterium]